MTINTNSSASEIAANLTTACVHAWQAMGKLGASSPTNALHATYAECKAAIESAGTGLHLRCAEDAAEIARLQAQVDALADSLKRIRLHCANASSYRLGQAVDSIAEHALSAVGR